MTQKFIKMFPCIKRGTCLLSQLPRVIVLWYMLILFGVFVFLLGMIHVWWITSSAARDANDTLTGVESATISRDELNTVLEMYERRATTFEALKQIDIRVSDPAE